MSAVTECASAMMTAAAELQKTSSMLSQCVSDSSRLSKLIAIRENFVMVPTSEVEAAREILAKEKEEEVKALLDRAEELLDDMDEENDELLTKKRRLSLNIREDLDDRVRQLEERLRLELKSVESRKLELSDTLDGLNADLAAKEETLYGEMDITEALDELRETVAEKRALKEELESRKCEMDAEMKELDETHRKVAAKLESEQKRRQELEVAERQAKMSKQEMQARETENIKEQIERVKGQVAILEKEDLREDIDSKVLVHQLMEELDNQQKDMNETLRGKKAAFEEAKNKKEGLSQHLIVILRNVAPSPRVAAIMVRVVQQVLASPNGASMESIVKEFGTSAEAKQQLHSAVDLLKDMGVLREENGNICL